MRGQIIHCNSKKLQNAHFEIKSLKNIFGANTLVAFSIRFANSSETFRKKKKISESLFGQYGWILASFFSESLWTSTPSRSINTQKRNLANIQPY